MNRHDYRRAHRLCRALVRFTSELDGLGGICVEHQGNFLTSSLLAWFKSEYAPATELRLTPAETAAHRPIGRPLALHAMDQEMRRRRLTAARLRRMHVGQPVRPAPLPR